MWRTWVPLHSFRYKFKAMKNIRHTPDNVTIRTMKVYQKVIVRRSPFCYHRSYAVGFPEINLMGKWLANCGFEIGHMIDVYCQDGQLTIRLAEQQPADDEPEAAVGDRP